MQVNDTKQIKIAQFCLRIMTLQREQGQNWYETIKWNNLFKSRLSDSIRRCVRWSVCRSVGLLVGLSVRPHFFFRKRENSYTAPAQPTRLMPGSNHHTKKNCTNPKSLFLSKRCFNHIKFCAQCKELEIIFHLSGFPTF